MWQRVAMPVIWSAMVVVVIAIEEMREGIQVRIKTITITITILWERRGGEYDAFGFDVGCSGSSWRYC